MLIIGLHVRGRLHLGWYGTKLILLKTNVGGFAYVPGDKTLRNHEVAEHLRVRLMSCFQEFGTWICARFMMIKMN